jgi:hypothetical protein
MKKMRERLREQRGRWWEDAAQSAFLGLLLIS